MVVSAYFTTLEFFQHQFSEMGHRDPPYDPNLSPPVRQPLSLFASREANLPPGGFVQTGFWEVEDTLQGGWSATRNLALTKVGASPQSLGSHSVGNLTHRQLGGYILCSRRHGTPLDKPAKGPPWQFCAMQRLRLSDYGARKGLRRPMPDQFMRSRLSLLIRVPCSHVGSCRTSQKGPEKRPPEELLERTS